MPAWYLQLYVLCALVFNALIFLEAFYSQWRSRGWYSLRDTCANVAMYWGFMLIELLHLTFVFHVYAHLARFAIFTPIEPIGLYWILLFLGDDLCFYFYHRFSHRVRILWSSHNVHHSSEHYNLTTALRQTWTPFASLLFWCPLVLLGFRPIDILVMQGLSLIYQSVLHTRSIGKLGLLEFVLNTPSSHRVHHGRNKEYLDRNFGGVLIVWDRLFGTFVPERDDSEYGTTDRVVSANPFRIAWHDYGRLLMNLRTADSFSMGTRLILAAPGSAGTPDDRRDITDFAPGEAHRDSLADQPAFLVCLAGLFALLYALHDRLLGDYLPEALAFGCYGFLVFSTGIALGRWKEFWAARPRTTWLIVCLPAWILPALPGIFEVSSQFRFCLAIFTLLYTLKVRNFLVSKRGPEFRLGDWLNFIVFYPSLFPPRLASPPRQNSLRWIFAFLGELVKVLVGVAGVVLIAWLPLSWHASGLWDAPFWFLVATRCAIVWLLLSGVLGALRAYFSFFGFIIPTHFSAPWKWTSPRRLWTSFNRHWHLSYCRAGIRSPLAAFFLSGVSFEYAFAVAGFQRYGCMLAFFLIQSIPSLLFKHRFRRLPTIAALPLTICWIVGTSILFFQTWDQLFLE